ncbi:MAG TPA: hypothetical protein VFJ16_06760 [Longimicrobium sp.]|nr:hypothetical protein [Longimicrobium sp.]
MRHEPKQSTAGEIAASTMVVPSAGRWRNALGLTLIGGSAFLPVVLTIGFYFVWQRLMEFITFETPLVRWLAELYAWAELHPIRFVVFIPVVIVLLPLTSMVTELVLYWYLGNQELLSEWGLRLTSRSTEARYLDDVRNPILYLRSFDQESQSILPYERRFGYMLTWSESVAKHESAKPERIIAEELHRCGTFVALTRHGERLAPTGAIRIRVDDSEWQRAFSKLLASSILVVFNARVPTPSLVWEIEETIRQVDPTRILFFLAFPIPQQGTRPAHGRQRAYDEFRSRFGTFFPTALPVTLGEAWFLGFQHDWTPVLFSAGDESYLFETDRIRSVFRKAMAHVWQCSGTLPEDRKPPVPYRLMHTASWVASVALLILVFIAARPLVLRLFRAAAGFVGL